MTARLFRKPKYGTVARYVGASTIGMLSRSFVQVLRSRLMALEREFADWKKLKTAFLVTADAAAADAAAALPVPPVERVVVNPAPPATAVPFVSGK